MDDHDKPEWREATIVNPRDIGVTAVTTWIGPLLVLVHGADDGYGWWWTIARNGREVKFGADLATMDEAKAEAVQVATALMRKRPGAAKAPTPPQH